jgi:antitoxin (DNA-binding transcriptional repressor) of toxin-antitoxin stability system
MTLESYQLEKHFREYLREICSTGQSLTVCENGQPIATLSPLPKRAKHALKLIDELLTNPIKIPGFKLLTREEVYER